jgi:hypothetical protein
MEDIKCDVSTSASIIEDNEGLYNSRHVVTQLSVDHPDWLRRSRDLASLLSKLFYETGRDILLVECIAIQRQIHSVCTLRNLDGAVSATDLASSLTLRFTQTGEESLLDEAISLNRESLSLRPREHPDRSI